jgi:hypothetical protein
MFTEFEWHSKLANLLCKIYRENPRMAFVKVVGGSEMYNFRIQRFVQLY